MRNRSRLTLVIPFTVTAAGAAAVQAPPAQPHDDWRAHLAPGQACAIQERYAAELAELSLRGECAPLGPCDTVAERDAAIPDENTPIKWIRISIHIFCRTDWALCASTEEIAYQQVATLNETLAPYRFQFIPDVRRVNRTKFFNFDPEDDAEMKSTYADRPDHKLNVYVVRTGGYAYGYFPWFAAPTDWPGGVVIDQALFSTDGLILTHEVGHCLGLWHTHHGVSEMPSPPCNQPCYERADGMNADTTGDLCADTPATPVNFNCADPGTTDACSGTPWGITDWRNYMSYAAWPCYEHFSPQQAGRCHCWTAAELSGWVTCPGDVNGDLIVDLADLAAVVESYGGAGEDLPGDFDLDGVVDISDLAELLAAYGDSCQ